MDWIRKTLGFSQTEEKAPELAKSPAENGFVFVESAKENLKDIKEDEKVQDPPSEVQEDRDTDSSTSEEEVPLERMSIEERLPFEEYSENEKTFTQQLEEIKIPTSETKDLFLRDLSNQQDDDLIYDPSSDEEALSEGGIPDLVEINGDNHEVIDVDYSSRWEFSGMTEDTEAVGENYIESIFSDVFARNRTEALKLLFFVRDPRIGNGNFKVFKICIRWLINNGFTQMVSDNLQNFSRYGSFKDYWFLMDTPLKYQVVSIFSKQLKEDLENLHLEKFDRVSLCAKHAPTEGKKIDKKYRVIPMIISDLGITKSEYRKLYLRPLRDYLDKCEAIRENGNNYVTPINVNRFREVFQDQTYYNYRYSLFKKIEYKFDNIVC